MNSEIFLCPSWTENFLTAEKHEDLLRHCRYFVIDEL